MITVKLMLSTGKQASEDRTIEQTMLIYLRPPPVVVGFVGWLVASSGVLNQPNQGTEHASDDADDVVVVVECCPLRSSLRSGEGLRSLSLARRVQVRGAYILQGQYKPVSASTVRQANDSRKPATTPN